jgi:hypothetical protein
MKESWAIRRGDLIALEDGGYLAFPRQFQGGVYAEHYCPLRRAWTAHWWPFDAPSAIGDGEVTPRHLYGRWAVVALEVNGLQKRQPTTLLGAPFGDDP